MASVSGPWGILSYVGCRRHSEIWLTVGLVMTHSMSGFDTRWPWILDVWTFKLELKIASPSCVPQWTSTKCELSHIYVVKLLWAQMAQNGGDSVCWENFTFQQCMFSATYIYWVYFLSFLAERSTSARLIVAPVLKPYLILTNTLHCKSIDGAWPSLFEVAYWYHASAVPKFERRVPSPKILTDGQVILMPFWNRTQSSPKT